MDDKETKKERPLRLITSNASSDILVLSKISLALGFRVVHLRKD